MSFDAIIIGGGPSGYTCAIRLSQLGQKVALIERDYIGGICVNWGCTPSKAMISSAKVAQTIKNAKKYGLEVGDVKVNFAAAAQRRDEIINTSRLHIKKALDKYNVTVLQGEGEILQRDGEMYQVLVKKGQLDTLGEKMELSGETETLLAKHVVIATGSAPLIPNFLNAKDPSIINSNRLITINTLPKKLTIVGGGFIGMEFATIFSSLGCEVTVIEFMDRILTLCEEEVSNLLTETLSKQGVKIMTGCQVLDIQNGRLKYKNKNTNEEFELESPVNLIAIGRKAIINNQSFDNLGLEYTPKGINVNEFLQTNLPNIWATGDATGKSILAHVGIQQGIIAGENIATLLSNQSTLRAINYEVIPAVVYTLPEIAVVGSVPSDLTGVEIYQLPMSENLRAHIEGHSEGFIKIWVKNSELLAAQTIGYLASEIIQELANAISLKTPIAKLADIIHAHPTYNEINRTIFEHALDRAIEVV